MNNDLELYIHIPFCVRKCNYCDFLSAPGTDEQVESYVKALINEIKACKAEFAGFNITSIFIGGGTPSILSVDQITEIVEALKSVWDLNGLKKKGQGLLAMVFKRKKKPHFTGKTTGGVSESFDSSGKTLSGSRFEVESLEHSASSSSLPKIEFTIECNPGAMECSTQNAGKCSQNSSSPGRGSIDVRKLKAYRKLGINRLSIGAQSVFDNELKELGRIHTSDDFLKTFEAARMAGFTNINVDLMQAIPLQTRESWRKCMMMVAALRPEHISAYSLIIEEGTPFYERMHSDFPLALPDEDTERDIYHDTKEVLEKFGYHRYEISNYSLDGYECEHNKGYWTRKNYLGLGIGAASMVNNVRWKNIDSLPDYINVFSSNDENSQTLVSDASVAEPLASQTSENSQTSASNATVAESLASQISENSQTSASNASVAEPLASQASETTAGPLASQIPENSQTSASNATAAECLASQTSETFDTACISTCNSPFVEGESILSKIRVENEKLSKADQMAEYMILGLRLTEGISKEDFINEFGVAYDVVYGNVTKKLTEQGLLVVVEKKIPWPENSNGPLNYLEEYKTETRVMLTEFGTDVSNQVLAEFMP